MFDKLLESSKAYSAKAMECYLREELTDFYIFAATSLELMLKATLVSIHPSLIACKDATKNNDIAPLLHLCVGGKYAKKPDIKTIGARDSLERVIYVYPHLKKYKNSVFKLFNVRNGLLHLAILGPVNKDEIWQHFLMFTRSLLDELAIVYKDYFGDFHDYIESAMQDITNEMEIRVKYLIKSASDYLSHRFSGISPELREQSIQQIVSSYQLDKYDSILVDCPACKNKGLLSGDHEVEWSADIDRDGVVYPYAQAFLYPSNFCCKVCNFSLDTLDLLSVAGVEAKIELDIDTEEISKDLYGDYYGEEY